MSLEKNLTGRMGERDERAMNRYPALLGCLLFSDLQQQLNLHFWGVRPTLVLLWGRIVNDEKLAAHFLFPSGRRTQKRAPLRRCECDRSFSVNG